MNESFYNEIKEILISARNKVWFLRKVSDLGAAEKEHHNGCSFFAPHKYGY